MLRTYSYLWVPTPYTAIHIQTATGLCLIVETNTGNPGECVLRGTAGWLASLRVGQPVPAARRESSEPACNPGTQPASASPPPSFRTPTGSPAADSRAADGDHAGR